MLFPKKLETKNLILKKPELTPEFQRKLYEIASGESGEKITEYMSWSPHSNIKETEKIIKEWDKEFREGECLNYKIVEQDSYNFVGMASLNPNWSKNNGQLGCWLRPNYWGKSYSRERALALIELGFEYLGLNHIFVRFDSKNKKCESSVSKYMNKVNGSKKLEEKEYVKGKRRKTITFIVSNIDYEESGGINIIKEYEHGL